MCRKKTTAEKPAIQLRKLTLSGYADQVYDYFTKEVCIPVHNGKWIPDEISASRILGINRGTFRKAVSSLKQKGLLASRKKSGTQITCKKCRKKIHTILFIYYAPIMSNYARVRGIIIDELEKSAEHKGIEITVIIDNNQETVIRHITESGCSGIILYGAHLPLYTRVKGLGIPFLLLNHVMDDQNCIIPQIFRATLTFDYFTLAYTTGNNIIHENIDNFFFFYLRQNVPAAEGFAAAFKEKNISVPEDRIIGLSEEDLRGNSFLNLVGIIARKLQRFHTLVFMDDYISVNFFLTLSFCKAEKLKYRFYTLSSGPGFAAVFREADVLFRFDMQERNRLCLDYFSHYFTYGRAPYFARVLQAEVLRSEGK